MCMYAFVNFLVHIVYMYGASMIFLYGIVQVRITTAIFQSDSLDVNTQTSVC
eukprot:m.175181 g.175181  ORF g.175181 m.175181 type:complete len:52 (-) comp15420_c0_seq3:255-410(-)